MNKSKIYPKYMLLLPLVFYVVFFLVPSTFGYGLAFTDWSATNSKFSALSFVGIQNLLDALKNRDFEQIARNMRESVMRVQDMRNAKTRR